VMVVRERVNPVDKEIASCPTTVSATAYSRLALSHCSISWCLLSDVPVRV
jgi:hypothetical protein